MSGPLVLGLRILLAACLYTFLALILFSLWRELKQQAAILAGRKIPPITLTAASGEKLIRAQKFSLAEITLGRDPACEFQLEDALISARHARLSFHHNQWWLEDLNSTNGTFLGGVRLSTPTVLVSGDEMKCGETRIHVSFGEEGPLDQVKKGMEDA
jgi:hypothetical protein